MDIEEIKKYAKNKIEAGELTKQVRQRIKETAWDKQNKREGFSETFKPLISQFEKPEDTKRKNIFTQNQEMLRNQLALTEGLRDNQLALTEGLRDNQRAITQGFNQFERLADIREVAPPPPIEEQPDIIIPKKITTFNLEKNFNKDEIEYLLNFNYPRPNNFLDVNPKELEEIYELVDNEKILTGNLIGALKRTKNKTEAEKMELDYYIKQHKILSKYKNILNMYLKSIDLIKVGEGRVQRGRGINFYFSPQELLHRFELLNGSLAAGNNGVLPEFIQIAHRLKDLGIINNNQLNTLLRKII